MKYLNLKAGRKEVFTKTENKKRGSVTSPHTKGRYTLPRTIIFYSVLSITTIGKYHNVIN